MFEESVSSIPSIWASMNSWFTPTIFFLLLNVMIASIYVTSTLATATQKHHPDADHHRQILRSPSVLQRLKSVNFYNTHRSHEHSYQTQFGELTHHPPPSTAGFHTHSAADFDKLDSHFEDPHQNRLLPRSASLLHRIKSINLYNYFSHEPTSASAATTVAGAESDALQAQTHVGTDTLYGSRFIREEEVSREDGGDDEKEVESPAAEEEEELQPSMEEIYSKLQESGRMSRTKSDTKPASGEMPAKLARKMKKSASSKSAFRHFEAEEVVEARRPATVREGKSAEEADEEVDSKADDFINKFKQQLKLQRINSINRYKEMSGRGSSNN